jgi:NADH dehydrogenase
MSNVHEHKRPHVVIVGGGFGGLSAAQALRNVPVDITLIDRRNHHLFQPLLYQVATAQLSPADIAVPIRKILNRQKNVDVILAEVNEIDTGRCCLSFKDSELELDYTHLILATGATHSYFGKPDWATLAPGLKTIEDATEIRWSNWYRNGRRVGRDCSHSHSQRFPCSGYEDRESDFG